MPIKTGLEGRIAFELIDAFFRAYDDYQPLKRGEPHAASTPPSMSRLEPGLVGALVRRHHLRRVGHRRRPPLRPQRARRHRARRERPRPHHRRDGHPRPRLARGQRLRRPALRRRGPRRAHAGARPRQCARRRQRHRRVGPVTASLGGLPQARVRVRPGKGIHVVFDRRLTNYGILSEAIDGRQIFLEPWQNMSVIGTTDDDYYGDLDDVRATSEEVRYLVQGIARVFPTVRQARAIGTYAGVRPTLYAFGPHRGRALARARDRRPRRRRRAGRLLDDRRQARELPPLRPGDERRRWRAGLRLGGAVRDAHAPPARRRRACPTPSRWPTSTASRRWRRAASSTATARAPQRILERTVRRPRARTDVSARASRCSRPRCGTS